VISASPREAPRCIEASIGGVEEARYDGLAEAYNAFLDVNEPYYRASRDALRRLLGRGEGSCLDLGCGGAQFVPTLQELGWTPIGVDESTDQLRIAGERFPDVEFVHADAAAIPFGDASFDAAISTFTHTDFEGFDGAVREILRVLKPSAPFVYVGNHPCFVGASQEHLDTGLPKLHPGYRRAGPWSADDAPGAGAHGWRARLGTFIHLPLGQFLSSFRGFELAAAEELEDGWEYPKTIAISLRKP
jgi:SAM-dependent methyltransferase